jgi:GST-like protein
MAIFPWVRGLVDFYGAGDLVGISEFPRVTEVLQVFLNRSAVLKGVNIPKRD